jgi:hypothetical protein
MRWDHMGGCKTSRPFPAQIARRHAMNPALTTDIGKEASVARSGSLDDEIEPKIGQQFALCGSRSPGLAGACLADAYSAFTRQISAS